MQYQYKILENCSPRELAEEVQDYMNSGWRPLGAPFFRGSWYVQAVTLEEKKETNDDGLHKCT